jgi:hypothetical protein
MPLTCIAGSDGTFWGTYQGNGRACLASFLVIDQDTVSLEECKKAPYTTIESKHDSILIEVKPSANCEWQVVKIENIKSNYSASAGEIAVKTYKNRDRALVDSPSMYCGFMPVDPSLAQDQTENFLNGKTGAERNDALKKINQQIHPDGDKYNEIGVRDPSPLVRDTAAWHLRGEPDHFVPILIHLMANDPDARVRASAGYSLSHFYTDNGSEGELYVKPLEDNLDELLKGLKNVETVRSIVNILGGRSFVPCFMSSKSREKVIDALRNQRKAIRLQAEAWIKDSSAPWSNELNEANHEIYMAIEDITKCSLSTNSPDASSLR